MADNAPPPASAEDREVNIYMDLLTELAPVLIMIGSAACFWCIFLTYRYIKARPSRKEIARKQIIARNARNRVRAVIGLNAMQNAFQTRDVDSDEEDLERPSVTAASKKQGAVHRAAAMSAFGDGAKKGKSPFGSGGSTSSSAAPTAGTAANAARMNRVRMITSLPTLEHDGP